MKAKSIMSLLGTLLLFFGFSFLIPIITGAYFWYRDGGGGLGLSIKSFSIAISPFLIPFSITGILGVFLQVLASDSDEPTNKEAFFTVGVGWFIIVALSSLPYLLSRTIPNPFDAFFESMSGFATCGASIVRDLEILPKSILMWRATTNWIGGLGIVALAIVVLSRIVGAGGANLYKAETSGHEIVKLRPKLRETATSLWNIYALLTFVEIVLLSITFIFRHKMPVDDAIFESICHSFATIATAGFGTRNASIAAFNDPIVEIIIIIFMVLGATNFVLHYKIKQGFKPYFRDEEFRVFVLSLAIATAFISINLWATGTYKSIGDCIRYASFNAVSLHTTTGFANADFAYWPDASRFVLFVLLFIGGCMGSTAGAIKMGRIIVLLKAAHREMRKALSPKAVIPMTFGKATIPNEIVNGICAFFFLYIAIFLGSTVLMLLFGGIKDGIFVAASAVATTMGGVGPGFGSIGPMANYADLTNAGKFILSIGMWIGRLEIYAPLMLFLPSTYRR
ncbi:MAG: TrkH family potassium uptake protein [Candidatus Thermoplasmatota archaeon]|nr:TrkH family potassium uptake protein [Candidatus Thermoplasmatota archaeon]